jgi:hypothetical protein
MLKSDIKYLLIKIFFNILVFTLVYFISVLYVFPHNSNDRYLYIQKAIVLSTCIQLYITWQRRQQVSVIEEIKNTLPINFTINTLYFLGIMTILVFSFQAISNFIFNKDIMDKVSMNTSIVTIIISCIACSIFLAKSLKHKRTLE